MAYISNLFRALSGTAWDGTNRYTTLTGNTLITLNSQRSTGVLLIQGNASYTLAINGTSVTINNTGATAIGYIKIGNDYMITVDLSPVMITTDTTLPTVTSATAINATTIRVVFSEVVTATNVGWSFKQNGAANNPSAVSGSGTNTLDFTVATMLNTDTILRSYDSATGNTLDGSGNELVAFTDQAVTNSISAGYDADAEAFFTAATITDTTQKDATNQLVIDLKAASIWTKMKAIYPFVGGTAITHKFNLKDPRDLDAAFRITFAGTVTHNANGITGDGSTGYGNTNFIPGNNTFCTGTGASQKGAMGVYLRAAVANASVMGAINASAPNPYQLITTRPTEYQFNSGNSTASINITTDTIYVGLLHYTRESETSLKAFRDGVQKGTTFTTASGAPGDTVYPFFLLARNSSGTAANFSLANLAFAYISDGLSDAEMASLATAVTTFQTALTRNV